MYTKSFSLSIALDCLSKCPLSLGYSSRRRILKFKPMNISNIEHCTLSASAQLSRGFGARACVPIKKGYNLMSLKGRRYSMWDKRRHDRNIFIRDLCNLTVVQRIAKALIS